MRTWNNLICSIVLSVLCLQVSLANYSTMTPTVVIGECEDESKTTIYNSSYNKSVVWEGRQNGKDRILVIGTSSQLANKVTKNQDVKFRKTTAKEAVADVNELVQNADAIMIDAKSMSEDALSKNVYIQRAMVYHVPVIAENINGKDLSTLTGFGVDAETVLFETKSDKDGVNIKFLTAIGETRLEKGKEQVFTPPVPSMAKVDSNQIKTWAKQHNMSINRTRKAKETSKDNPKERQPEFKQERIGMEEQFQLIRKELKSKAIIKKKNLGRMPRGGSSIGTPRRSGGPSPLDIDFSQEKNYETSLPVANRSWTVSVTFGTKTWRSGNYGQYHRIYINYDIVMDATTQFKYVTIRPTGTGFNPGGLLHDQWATKGFYQEKMYVEYGFKDDNSNIELLHTAPPNANNSSSLQTTTGYSIGASADGINLGYNESSVLTRELKEFQVINKSEFPRAKWEYRLSATPTGGEYKDWGDLGRAYQGRGWFEPGLHDLPILAKENLMPSSEAIFRLNNNVATGWKKMYFKNTHRTRYVWRDSFVPSFLWSPAVPDYKQLNYGWWFSLSSWINLDRVSI